MADRSRDRRFLARYAATLTAFDSRAATELWATPGMILDNRFAGVVDDRETIAQALEQSYPVYRKLGLASVTHSAPLSMSSPTRSSSCTCKGASTTHGQLLTDSTAYYVVHRDDDGLHACVCIQIDDAQKLQALAAERCVDLSNPTS